MRRWMTRALAAWFPHALTAAAVARSESRGPVDAPGVDGRDSGSGGDGDKDGDVDRGDKDGDEPKRLLVLFGATGAGKSTMVRVLARELGCNIREWRDHGARGEQVPPPPLLSVLRSVRVSCSLLLSFLLSVCVCVCVCVSVC